MQIFSVKFVSAVLLFATWAGFAAFGMTPVSGLVDAIQLALVSLGVFQATVYQPKKED